MVRFLTSVSILFDEKVNLVGALWRSKSHIPNNVQNRREKQKKNIKKNGEILRKIGLGVTKINYGLYWHFLYK